MKDSRKYLYSLKYDYHHEDLCQLETRSVFGCNATDKVICSDIEIDPSISPFIKNRLTILLRAPDYKTIIAAVKKLNIKESGFKVEYLSLHNDSITYDDRIQRCRDIGFLIEGLPNYDMPSITYGITQYENTWYFGILKHKTSDWLQHKTKPCSFSNSISIHIAKSLVTIVTKGDDSSSIIDACCGVGTVLLEACYAKFTIEGCDINLKSVKHARENLLFFNYEANIEHSDINQITKHYDAAIIDLPYNLYTQATDQTIINIIKASSKIAKRLIIVSITDISAFITAEGLKIVDFCTVEKRGKTKFVRSIWVCEKEEITTEAIAVA